MQQRLLGIIDGLRTGRFLNEASISQGAVLPLLDAMGWSVFDPRSVAPEYAVAGRRVDFALLDTAGRPHVFIEVKRTGQSVGSDVQLFEYAFHVGVPMAVLTDGQEWSIYLPAEQGSYEERRVYKLDLLERTATESEERLRRYLDHDRVLSGQSLIDARADYTDAARGRQVLSTLPIAWERLIRDRDEILLELLSDKVEDICGYRPSADDCASFLAQRAVPKVQSTPPPTPLRSRTTTNSVADVASHGPSYNIDGHMVRVRSAREVLEGLIGALADRDTSFLERFAARKHGRQRRYISRDRYELYPNRTDLAEAYSIEVRHGWWLSVNYSRANIEHILNLACEVAGLRRNKDVWFSVE